MHPADADPHGIDRERALSAVGVGWAPLVNRAFDALPPGARIVQVKEKFGQLRIYFDPMSWESRTPQMHEFQKELNAIEDESGGVCEVCGDVGRVLEIEKGPGWYVAACRCGAHNTRV